MRTYIRLADFFDQLRAGGVVHCGLVFERLRDRELLRTKFSPEQGILVRLQAAEERVAEEALLIEAALFDSARGRRSRSAGREGLRLRVVRGTRRTGDRLFHAYKNWGLYELKPAGMDDGQVCVTATPDYPPAAWFGVPTAICKRCLLIVMRLENQL